MKRFLAAAFMTLLPLAGSAADAPAPTPAPVQDWSKDIETVVVTAGQQGPLLWHIRKGDSEVYILGVVSPVPEKLAWSNEGVRAALKGAKQLILQPRASVGLFEGVWFMMWNRDAIYLPGGTTMESTLPDDLKKRFAAERNALHQDADRYSDYRVPLAALRLEGDFQKSRGFSYQEPSESVRHIASSLNVSTRAAATYEALPLIKQLPSMSAAANNVCMKAALDDIQAQSAHAQDAAEAWANGDLDGIKANYSESRFESCIESMPSFAALFQRAVTDSVSALNGALARPGKTVMVMSIGTLLRQNGVLDRLKAAGIAVDPPAQGTAG